jgi:hypothetical protein
MVGTCSGAAGALVSALFSMTAYLAAADSLAIGSVRGRSPRAV